MTRTTDAAQYDFRSPSRLAAGVARPFAEWQREFCKILSQRLKHHLPFAVNFGFLAIEPQSMRQALSAVTEQAVAFRFRIGPESLPGMFTLSRQFLLLLVNGMLGEVAKELPEDRELSHIEQSLSELVAEEITAALGEAWFSRHPIHFGFEGREPHPERTRIFPHNSTTLVSRLEADASGGVQSCQFILPYSILELIPLEAGPGNRDSAETRQQLESLVLSVPVTLAIQLGCVDLKISELAELEVGDVILLDQSAVEPLLASLDGQPRFRVWPGKIGTRRACEIADSV